GRRSVGVADRRHPPRALWGAAADAGGRCQGFHGAAAPPRPGGGPRRRGDDRRRGRRFRLQLRPARRWPGDVRLRAGGRAAADRRGRRRHRAAVGQIGLAWGVDGPQWPGPASPRRARHRPLGWQGEARGVVGRQAARRTPRGGPLLQHLRRLSHDPGGGGGRQRAGVARARRRRDQAEGGAPGCGGRSRPRRPRPRRARGWRAAHGRCERSVGPRHGIAAGAALGGVRPDLDRGAARRLRRRGPGRAGRRPGHADLDRRDADERQRARAPDRARRGRHPPARRPASRRDHPVPADRGAGRRARYPIGPALRNGDPHPPGGGTAARAVGRAFRLARTVVQRAPRPARGADARPHRPRPRSDDQRRSRRLARGRGRVAV
ncbi:MAG: L-talarate dehydratase @ Galactarate dehydratase, partial [uncultured Thermomicrobiales bacterium]